ncbi:hypothetical protein F4780DRAFT_774244 [Xylariomycetidae sp. FL0641]|nr:hypothetical protein F4780DRAFT_774244 [Xylariomycetidae sp. FL0641]
MTLDLTTLDAHEQPSPELRGSWKRYSRTEHKDFVNHPEIDELDPSAPDCPFQIAGHIPGERLRDSYRRLEGDVSFVPKDPSVHKPLSIKKVLDRRLSWVTLGGQYDWTNRQYPEQLRPEFPPDIAGLLHTLFPETQAQAAIVNFYSPGDTMMMHRDVSEHTDKGLVSLSIGCDALFMIAPSRKHEEDEKNDGESERKPYLLLRLRSGDAIYMSQESRYAWHGVPKVLKGTCPEFLADWPAEDGEFEQWRGWMQNKRINLNVRQMND